MTFHNFRNSEGKAPLNRKNLKLILSVGTLAGVIALGSTLAASINLNSGTPVEFGQGVAQTTACDDQITVTPKSTFINSENEAGHFFTSVDLSGIDGSSDHCGGKAFKIRAYGPDGLLILYIDDLGTPDQSDDISHSYWRGTLPVGANSLTANFPHDDGSYYGLSTAAKVERITVESEAGSGGTGALYGMTGAGSDLAFLYRLTINEETDIANELIGSLKYQNEQIRHATGLAWDPINSEFYFVSNNLGSLFKFDPNSAVNGEINVTLVGQIDLTNYPDLAFDPSGQLWGWSERSDDLVKINKNNAETTVFEVDISSWATGLASDLNGQLWLKTGTLYKLITDSNSVTNNPVYGNNLPSSAANLLTVDSNGIFWTGARKNDGSDDYTEIYTFDMTGRSEGSGEIPLNIIGRVAGIMLSSIEFTS